MPETMLDLWNRYRATWTDDDLEPGVADAVRAEIRRALAITGPVYVRDAPLPPFELPAPLLWVGLRRDGGDTLNLVGAGEGHDPGRPPPVLLGDGTARDAACVMVPGPKAETWRNRPPLFW